MTAAPRSHPFRVVMAGPLPPSIGGMTTVICDLRDSRLRDAVTLDLFDTAKRTPEGRSLRSAVGARLQLWRRWWSLLRARPRLAHIHTCSGLSFFLDGALALLARAMRVPVVLHVHGGRFDQFLDGLDPARRWLARHIARSAVCVIVVSEIWRTRLAARLPGARLRVVENGVPMPAEPARRTTSGEPLIVFIGAVCRAKGVEDLVRATAVMAHRCRVVLLGPETEAGMVERLRAIAAEHAMADRVVLPGPVSSTERADWLARATVFVLPSHVEALPMAVLEAMAAGCPVVATEVGALPTVIRSGANGLLVTPGDVTALAAALDRLLADGALRERFAVEARRDCRERFSIDRTVEQLQQIYVELC